MNQDTYTAIPDTSDTNYWELKAASGQDRSQTFVPRDKELHQKLKTQAWKAIQTSLSHRNRKIKY
jgi:hypothetical protein